jgi:hypothetical protein
MLPQPNHGRPSQASIEILTTCFHRDIISVEFVVCFSKSFRFVFPEKVNLNPLQGGMPSKTGGEL